ncbi:MAG: transposase [Verrucomicrobiales bacterium]
MRTARKLVSEESVGLYHVLSRVVERRLVFGEAEKAHFRKLLLAYAEFSGIDVVAWCLMGNHFHLLLRVPVKSGRHQDDPPDAEVLRRVGLINGRAVRIHLENLLAMCGAESSRRELLAPYRRRMGDLGLMMKSLKQRFTQWFNRNNERSGTLWEERYRSFIVDHEEDGTSQTPGVAAGYGEIARVVAAYIDANPVRAGLVSDPAEYRWSGFGEASSGSAADLSALARLWGLPGQEALACQRRMIIARGAEKVEPGALVASFSSLGSQPPLKSL